MIQETTQGRAHNAEVSLAYEVFGPSTGTPMLLLMGAGMQMVLWHDDFCHELLSTFTRSNDTHMGLEKSALWSGRPVRRSLWGRLIACGLDFIRPTGRSPALCCAVTPSATLLTTGFVDHRRNFISAATWPDSVREVGVR